MPPRAGLVLLSALSLSNLRAMSRKASIPLFVLSLAAAGSLLAGSENREAVPEAEPKIRSAAVLLPELPTRLHFGDAGWVSVGARVQAIFIYNDSDLVDDDTEFRMRRARIMVRGEVTEWAGFSLATEGAGGNVTLIDSYLHFKPLPEVQFFVGRHLVAGTGRQAGTTSAAALMAMDRPAFSYKNLSFGGRAMTAFATSTLAGTDSGLRMDAQVRDEGITFWGDRSLSDNLHLKYYAGVHGGSRNSPARDEGDLRYSGRVAVNFGDDERGFFNSSTYLGRKQTVGLGVSFDAQNRVAIDSGNDVNYRFWTVDLFAEQSLGRGSASFEAAYGQLDLDDAGLLSRRDKTTAFGDAAAVSGLQAQGDGFFAQAGYYFPNIHLQPWILYEEWNSDTPGGEGSYNNARIGLTYFARGQNLNFKIGYERTRLEANPNGDRNSNSIVTGVYMTF